MHRYEEYGSLASECLECGLPYVLSRTHQGWTGVPHRKGGRYTPAEVQHLTSLYLDHIEERPGYRVDPLVKI